MSLLAGLVALIIQNLHESRLVDSTEAPRKVQVESVVQLLDEGNTVPFITRYRKERTGGLNEEVIRHIQARVGAQMQGSASLTVTPGDADATNGNQGDVALTSGLNDIQTTAGIPRAEGPPGRGPRPFRRILRQMAGAIA